MVIMNIKNKLRKAKRIVVKIGTNTLSTKDGKMALSRIYGFIEDIAFFWDGLIALI